MLDLDDIAEVVAGAVREATKPLHERIAALEAREIPAPVTVDEEGIATRVLNALPTPEKGDPGEVDMEAVRALIEEAAQLAIGERLPAAIKEIELPAPLPPADPMAPDMEAIGKLIEAGIAKAVAEIPPAKEGEAGVGVAGGLIDRDGDLILTLSNGESKNVGRVVGEDGKSPPPFTLDDFDVEALDERTIKLKFEKGEICHSFELTFPVPIYQDVFKEGRDYVRGDMVTWGGSTWHCNEPKGLKPGVPDSGWHLAAKAGRPGKDAAK